MPSHRRGEDAKLDTSRRIVREVAMEPSRDSLNTGIVSDPLVTSIGLLDEHPHINFYSVLRRSEAIPECIKDLGLLLLFVSGGGDEVVPMDGVDEKCAEGLHRTVPQPALTLVLDRGVHLCSDERAKVRNCTRIAICRTGARQRGHQHHARHEGDGIMVAVSLHGFS
jgi:hypothetical protein